MDQITGGNSLNYIDYRGYCVWMDSITAYQDAKRWIIKNESSARRLLRRRLCHPIPTTLMVILAIRTTTMKTLKICTIVLTAL